MWTVYGKIASIIKSSDTTILFTYDAGGNRISKSIVHAGDTLTTWYVRDAQGNVLSVYTYGDPAVKGKDLTQTELHVYGSSRLGILKTVVDVEGAPAVTSSPLPPLGTIDSLIFTRGNKLFELTNHLGNVLATISDKRYGVSHDDSTVTYFIPEVVSANDYYPFGSPQPNRFYTESGVGSYRYGFNGKENDNEIKGAGDQQDYGERVYDPRVGKFLSVDPIDKKYPELTPYQFASNSPIMGVDLDGKELFIIHGTNQGTTPVLESGKGVIFGDSKISNKAILDQFERISGNTVFNDRFRWNAPLWNNQTDRTFAAYQLVSFIISTRQYLLEQKNISEDEPVSLLGYSHGGNVAIQASEILNKSFGIKVNLITLSTPAYRSILAPDPEDPRESSGINKHIHITHENDAVWFWAGGLPSYPYPSDNYYIQESEIPLKGPIESHTELPGSPELGKYLENITTMPQAPKPTGLNKAIKEKDKKEKEAAANTTSKS